MNDESGAHERGPFAKPSSSRYDIGDLATLWKIPEQWAARHAVLHSDSNARPPVTELDCSLDSADVLLSFHAGMFAGRPKVCATIDTRDVVGKAFRPDPEAPGSLRCANGPIPVDALGAQLRPERYAHTRPYRDEPFRYPYILSTSPFRIHVRREAPSVDEQALALALSVATPYLRAWAAQPAADTPDTDPMVAAMRIDGAKLDDTLERVLRVVGARKLIGEDHAATFGVNSDAAVMLRRALAMGDAQGVRRELDSMFTVSPIELRAAPLRYVLVAQRRMAECWWDANLPRRLEEL